MPRKLLLQMHISLDGKVGGIDNDFSWAIHNWDEELNNHITDLTKAVDRILIGRKLAEGFIPHWHAHPELDGAETFNALPKTVISTTVRTSPWGEKVQILGGRVEDEVRRLKVEDGGSIITYGGVQTAQTLVAAGLVDDLHLIVDPASVGGGGALFTVRADFELVDLKAFKCGVSVAHYRPRK